MAHIRETLKRALGLEHQVQYVRPVEIIARSLSESPTYWGVEKYIADIMSPFLAGESMFVDLHSHAPNPSIRPMFYHIGNWGLNHQLTVEAADLSLGPQSSKDKATALKQLRKWLQQAEQYDATLFMIYPLQNIGIENIKVFASKDMPAFFARQKKPVAFVVSTSHGLSLTEQTDIDTFGSNIRMVQATFPLKQTRDTVLQGQ